MALTRSPVPQNPTAKTASYLVFSLVPIGDFSGGDCTIILSSAALNISTIPPNNRTIATWRYSTIRDFSCTSTLFCFTSGRRGPFGVHKYVFKVPALVMPSLLTTLSTITGVDIAPLDASTEGNHSENWYSVNVPPPPPPLGNLEDPHRIANANFYADVVSVSASAGGTPTSSLFQVSPPPPSPFQVSPPPSTHTRDQLGAADAMQAAPPRRFWVRVPHSYEEIADPPCTTSAETLNTAGNPQRNGHPPLTSEIPSPLSESDSPTHQEGVRSPLLFPLPPTPPPPGLVANQQISPVGNRKVTLHDGGGGLKTTHHYEVARPCQSPELLKAVQTQQPNSSSSTLSSSGHNHWGQQVDPPSGRLQQQQPSQRLPLPDMAFLSGRYEMLPVFGGGAVTSNPAGCASHQCDGGVGIPSSPSASRAGTAQAMNSRMHPIGDRKEIPIAPLLKNADVVSGPGPVAPAATQVGRSHTSSSSQEISPVAVAIGGTPTRGWTSPSFGNATGCDKSNPSSTSFAIQATAAATPGDNLSFSKVGEEGYEVLTPRSDRRFLVWGVEGSPSQSLALQRPPYENWTPVCSSGLSEVSVDDPDGGGYIEMRESKSSEQKVENGNCASEGMVENRGRTLHKQMAEGDAVPALGIVHHVIRPTSNDTYSNVCLRVQVVTGGDL